MILVAALLAACSGNTTAPRALVSLKSAPAVPLTFYEGEDEQEPFTPYLIRPGSSNTYLALGYAQQEGATYVVTYQGAKWDTQSVSNGFSPSDPLWDCDGTPEAGVSIAPNATLLARPCSDGSATVFTLPDATTAYHLPKQDGSAITERFPAMVFSPQSTQIAITNDGPNGPGTAIAVMKTATWQTVTTISVANQLLSQPSWSPDGTRIAAVDMNGLLHVWSVSTGQELSATQLTTAVDPQAASAIASAAPVWTPDNQSVIASTAVTGGTLLSLVQFNGSSARIAQQYRVAYPAGKVLAQGSPDGAWLLIHDHQNHVQLLSTSTLALQGSTDLPGNLTMWNNDSRSIYVATNNASVVLLTITKA